MALEHVRPLTRELLRVKDTRTQAGFTLIELLVVTSILIIITGLMLVNHSQFGGKILLQNLAYDVALSIRQAQVYGISVRQFGSGNFGVAYGMHFAVSSPKTYELFGDGNGNGLWDAEENVSPSPYDISRGYYIDKLCAPAGADSEVCTAVNRLDVVFKRPEPDAFIGANGISGLTNPLESARIVFKSPRGDEASVVVEVTGQISVE